MYFNKAYLKRKKYEKYVKKVKYTLKISKC